MLRASHIQQILSTSKSILQRLPPPSRVEATPIGKLDIPSLRLTESTSHFHAEVLCINPLPQILSATLRRAAELAAVYEKFYEDACKRLIVLPRVPEDTSLERIIKNLQTTFEILYRIKGLPQLLVAASKAQATVAQLQGRTSLVHVPKPSFNHQYTPLLGRFFAENAYPSTADRLSLAKKTQMTPRQIEVWFQNHRRRAKKEGRTLKRLTPGTPIAPLVNPFQPSSSEGDSADSEEEWDQDDESTVEMGGCNPLDQPAPPHVFPAPFRRHSYLDPFPNRDGVFSFAIPSWQRRPATPQMRNPAITVEELTNLFGAMTLRSLSHKGGRTTSETGPWFAWKLTVPSTAPHPAFIPMPNCPYTAPFSWLEEPTEKASKRSTPVSRRTSPFFNRCKTGTIPYRRPTSHNSSRIVTPLSETSTAGSRSSSFSSVSSTSTSARSISSSSQESLPETPPMSPINPLNLSFTESDLASLDFFLESHSPDFIDQYIDPSSLFSDVLNVKHSSFFPQDWKSLDSFLPSPPIIQV